MQIDPFGVRDHLTITGNASSPSGLFGRGASASLDNTSRLMNGNSSAGQINRWYDAIRSLAGSVRTLTLTGATGGTFALGIVSTGTPAAAGFTTSITVAYNSLASALQSQIIAAGLPGTTVSGSAGGPYTITFTAAVGSVALTADATLLTGTTPTAVLTNTQIANATTAATFGTPVTTGGTLVGGTSIYVTYTFKTSSGETLQSAEAVYAVPAGTSTNIITATTPSVPSGATGINVYVGAVSGSESFAGTSSGNTFVITALPSAGAALPSPWNTTFSVSETLNLTNGSLADPFGIAITFKGLSALHIENQSLTSPLAEGGATFGGWKVSSAVKWYGPGYVWAPNGTTTNGYNHDTAYGIAGGFKVIASVNDTIKVTSYDPNGVSYGIFIPGNS